MIYRLVQLSAVLSILVLAGTFIYEVPEPEWQDRVIDNKSYGKFIDIDAYNSDVGVAYPGSLDSGLAYQETDYSFSPLSLITGSERNWEKQGIDNSSEAGMYLSLDLSQGHPRISYQQGELGDEKLYYAERKNSEWTRQEIDNVAQGGVSVGMYTSLSSLNQKPVILYHSPSQGLKIARKNEKWQTQQLENDQGWFTGSSSCGNTVKAAYTGRDSNNLKKAEINGSWSSENTGMKVRSDLDMDTSNCQTHLVYLNDSSDMITYRSPSGKTHTFTETFFSRMSIEVEDKVHVTYHEPGTGLVYQRKEDSEWIKETVGEGDDTGRYNDIAVDQQGNVHIAYIDREEIHYAVYNSGKTQKLEQRKNQVRKGTLILLIVSIIALGALRGGL